MTQPQARDAWSPQQPEEAGRTLPRSLRREHTLQTSGYRSQAPGCEKVNPDCSGHPLVVTAAPGDSHRAPSHFLLRPYHPGRPHHCPDSRMLFTASFTKHLVFGSQTGGRGGHLLGWDPQPLMLAPSSPHPAPCPSRVAAHAWEAWAGSSNAWSSSDLEGEGTFSAGTGTGQEHLPSPPCPGSCSVWEQRGRPSLVKSTMFCGPSPYFLQVSSNLLRKAGSSCGTRAGNRVGSL